MIRYCIAIECCTAPEFASELSVSLVQFVVEIQKIAAISGPIQHLIIYGLRPSFDLLLTVGSNASDTQAARTQSDKEDMSDVQ